MPGQVVTAPRINIDYVDSIVNMRHKNEATLYLSMETTQKIENAMSLLLGKYDENNKGSALGTLVIHD